MSHEGERALIHPEQRTFGGRTCYVLGALASIVLTPSLTVVNRLLLRNCGVRGCAALLAALHNCMMFLLSTVHRSRRTSELKYPKYWPLLASFFSCLGILLSNIILKLTTIGTHQFCKVLVIPASAVVDRYVFGDKRNFTDLFPHGVVFLAATLAIGGAELPAEATAPALMFIFCTAFGSAWNRYVYLYHKARADDIIGILAPYSCVFSMLLYLISACTSTSPSTMNSAVGFLPLDVCLLITDVVLAICVQLFGTWSAAVSSNTLYATIGQAKLALTIFVGSYVTNEQLSRRTIFCCLTITVTTTFAIICEAYEFSQHKKLAITMCLFVAAVAPFVIETYRAITA